MQKAISLFDEMAFLLKIVLCIIDIISDVLLCLFFLFKQPKREKHKENSNASNSK
jgi:hypothetical protein